MIYINKWMTNRSCGYEFLKNATQARQSLWPDTENNL